MSFAKINHVAIVSERYALLSKFYETLFDMKGSTTGRSGRAVTVRDGYVGLNINPRKAGRPSGLDHFGIEVQDVETVFERMSKKYPQSAWVKRPSTRPFAGISANDPDGNVFDISQKDMANRSEVYVENEKQGTLKAERRISHMAIRTMHPEQMAQFYAEVFELTPQNKQAGDPNEYLSDGRMTIMFIPWKIDNFVGQSILPTGPDHIGFTVESIDKLKEDLDEIVGINPIFNPIPVGKGKEGGARHELLQKQCPISEFFFSDPDFTMLAVHEEA